MVSGPIGQKFELQNTHGLVGAGQVRSGLGPYPGVWQVLQVQGEGLQPWLGEALECFWRSV